MQMHWGGRNTQKCLERLEAQESPGTQSSTLAHQAEPTRQEMSRTQEATSFLIKHVGWRVGDKSCEHTEPCTSVKLLSPVPWGLLGCPVKVKGNSHAVLVGKAKCSNTLESGNSTQEK